MTKEKKPRKRLQNDSGRDGSTPSTSDPRPSSKSAKKREREALLRQADKANAANQCVFNALLKGVLNLNSERLACPFRMKSHESLLSYVKKKVQKTAVKKLILQISPSSHDGSIVPKIVNASNLEID